MALRDVKEYYYKVQAQYLEMKADLEDFNEALRAGHITEDQLEGVKNDVFQLEQNYNRLTYVLFLLEQPRRKEKVKAFNERNESLVNYFKTEQASEEEVLEENKSVLNHLRGDMAGLRFLCKWVSATC